MMVQTHRPAQSSFDHLGALSGLNIPAPPQPPPPPPSSVPMPIDPALSQGPLYQGQFYGHYQPSPPQHHTTPSQSGHISQVSLAASLSSASSPSDAMSTPPTEQLAYASPGKRPSSASTEGDRKRQKQEDDPSASPIDKEGAPKAKPTRGSRSETSFLFVAHGFFSCSVRLVVQPMYHVFPCHP